MLPTDLIHNNARAPRRALRWRPAGREQALGPRGRRAGARPVPWATATPIPGTMAEAEAAEAGSPPGQVPPRRPGPFPSPSLSPPGRVRGAEAGQRPPFS